MKLLLQQLLITGLFGLLFSACGNEETLKLSYRLSAINQPDLMFIVGLDDLGGGVYEFRPNLSSDTFDPSYDSLNLGAQLVSCSVEQQDVQDLNSLPTDSFYRSGSCEGLGQYIGQVLFSGRAVKSNSDQELRTELSINSKTKFLFFMAVYNAADVGASPRCARMFSLEKRDEGLRFLGSEGFVTSKSLSLEITEPSLGVNCYSLNE